MITMTERNEKFRLLQEKMFEVQDAKGRDYGEETDGMRNLRRRGVHGVVARMGDKMSRIEILTQPNRTAAVKDETLDDTLIDLANYCLLLIILKDEDNGK
jgi:Nucleotide modification associated domain 1